MMLRSLNSRTPARIGLSGLAFAALSVSACAQTEGVEEAAANATAEVQPAEPESAAEAPSNGDAPDGALSQEDLAAMFGMTAPAPPADYSAGPDAEGFDSFEQRVSYAIGASMGGQMAREFAEFDFAVDAEKFGEGFGDAADPRADGKLTEAQMQETLMQFQSDIQQRQMAKLQASINADTEFLRNNAEADGVVVTDSGVQYRVTELGDGPKPGPSDTVLVHYEGKLLDGHVFDSSVQRGQPVPFPLDGVIPGFQAGLTQMPVGSKGTLFIPADQAYGMQPPPGSGIGPSQMLIFDVELIELLETVEPAAEAPAEHDHDHASHSDADHDHAE
ncbi:MAG: FKBP-type peptidyl-prolyl cis-trans isomerase [Planctomycetota bacterium]